MTRRASACSPSWARPKPTSRRFSSFMRISRPRRCDGARLLPPSRGLPGLRNAPRLRRFRLLEISSLRCIPYVFSFSSSSFFSFLVPLPCSTGSEFRGRICQASSVSDLPQIWLAARLDIRVQEIGKPVPRCNDGRTHTFISNLSSLRIPAALLSDRIPE